MSNPYPVFPVGSVGYNLMLLRGTWHDHIELYNLDGTPLDDDSAAGSGSPGPGPFDNLVYIDFDGDNTLEQVEREHVIRVLGETGWCGQ